MGIVGGLIVIICVFGGFILAGGHLHVIWQPFEVMIIGGAALGGFVIANPIPRIKLTISKSIHAIFAKPPGKQDYIEILQMMFQLFQIFRKDGPQAVEKHIEEPASSEIFKAYPGFLKTIMLWIFSVIR